MQECWRKRERAQTRVSDRDLEPERQRPIRLQVVAGPRNQKRHPGGSGLGRVADLRAATARARIPINVTKVGRHDHPTGVGRRERLHICEMYQSLRGWMSLRRTSMHARLLGKIGEPVRMGRCRFVPPISSGNILPARRTFTVGLLDSWHIGASDRAPVTELSLAVTLFRR